MSFRVSALVAAVVVLELSSSAPVAAQPQAPIRPRNNTFGNIFTPGRQLGGAGFGQNQPFVNPLGPQVAGVGGPQAFVQPGQAVYPQSLPIVFGTGTETQLQPTGVVGTFTNLGHWYGGNYVHWYPGGVANGRGVLGGGIGGGGGGYAGGVGPPVGQARQGGSIVGTAAGVGATVGMMRR